MDHNNNNFNNNHLPNQKADEEELQYTGSLAEKNLNNKSKYYFSTQELLIASILGIMGGFISSLIPFSLLIKTWYPFIGGTQLVSGHHLLWMVLVYGLTKKKKTMILTATIQGFIGFLFGSNWGIFEVLIMLYEGIFLIFGFYLVELFREGNSNLGWAIAGGIGNVSQVPLFWIITGKIWLIHWSLFVMACMFGFISGVFLAGLLGKLISKRIKNSGII
nr:ECF transporter S component [Candidatus Prometheoarchaeum syntrophicum]QEE16630.1 ABC-type cobalt transport system, permease component [Candidatus Prometheoarchaeum syntrophicum]